MESLFDATKVDEVKRRLAQIGPDSSRQWGQMTAAQALAHCSIAMQMAVGEVNPSRTLVGRILGPTVKPMALRENAPLRRNTPTAKVLVVWDQRDLRTERERLLGLIERFAKAGPMGCTQHFHMFFGKLTPDEWGRLMYKHLDHHLRQFGV